MNLCLNYTPSLDMHHIFVATFKDACFVSESKHCFISEFGFCWGKWRETFFPLSWSLLWYPKQNQLNSSSFKKPPPPPRPINFTKEFSEKYKEKMDLIFFRCFELNVKKMFFLIQISAFSYLPCRWDPHPPSKMCNRISLMTSVVFLLEHQYIWMLFILFSFFLL